MQSGIKCGWPLLIPDLLRNGGHYSMNSALSTPAAQYLRMSTEHQSYSLDNQSSAIARYAEANGFKITQTYVDAARSGIVLKHRSGLKQLLQDVVSGKSPFEAILVYDVSRWGRFQDIDESAHYEFLCKTAGVPVHYCAEMFGNKGSLQDLIMKTMKRTMAREYSRELGVKVLAGQKRLAQLGFKQGGIPGYGLRRMLISGDRLPKMLLLSGQRKSINTDRVILVPGPRDEIDTVREIYRLLTEDKLSVYGIARHLMAKGIPYATGSEWDYSAVYSVLTHPKYMGVHVFNRTSSRLYTPTVRVPKKEWVVTPGAFEPIVDQAIFEKAQQILSSRTVNKSDDELLEQLRELLCREGRLSLHMIANSPGMPSPSTFRQRFGGLRRVYELIGYGLPQQFGPCDLRRRTQALRKQLVRRIAETFPNEMSIICPGGRWRENLCLRDGTTVSVLVCRACRPHKACVRWQVEPVKHESQHLTLLAQMDATNMAFRAYCLVPSLGRTRRFSIREDDPWLDQGIKFNDPSQLLAALSTLKHRSLRN